MKRAAKGALVAAGSAFMLPGLLMFLAFVLFGHEPAMMVILRACMAFVFGFALLSLTLVLEEGL